MEEILSVAVVLGLFVAPALLLARHVRRLAGVPQRDPTGRSQLARAAALLGGQVVPLPRALRTAASILGATVEPDRFVTFSHGVEVTVAVVEAAWRAVDPELDRTSPGGLAPARLVPKAITSELRSARQRLCVVQAQATSFPGFRIEVHRKVPSPATIDLLSTQAAVVRTGEPAFGERLVLRSTNPELAAAWVDGDLLRLAAGHDSYAIVLDEVAVTAVREGVEETEGALREVVDAVARLATGGARVLARWREVAASIGGALAPGTTAFAPGVTSTIVVDMGGRRVVLDVEEVRAASEGGASRLRTRLRAHLLRPASARLVLSSHEPPEGIAGLRAVAGLSPELEEACWVRSDDEATAREIHDEALCRRIVALDADLLSVVDQTVTVVLPGFETSARWIREAMAVALALADATVSAQAGPYR